VTDVATPVGTAAAQVPTAVTGSGGNQATGSVASAQVGGGNQATNSAGKAQVKGVQSRPATQAAAAGRNGGASAPVGTSAVEGPSTAAPAGGATISRLAPSLGAPSTSGSGTSIMVSSEGLGGVNGQLSADLQQLAFETQMLGLSPDSLFLFDPLAQLMLSGTVGAGPNGGNSSTGSLGAAQLGSVAFDPALTVLSPALGSEVAIAGESGVDGGGVNSTDGSTGTAQAGGGNTADRSVGTAQVGGVELAPTVAASTPYGNADVAGGSGIDGGANDASGSVGSVQIGGGNRASGSTGSAQASGITVGPTIALTETPAGDVALGGSSGIAGGGNDASDSAGTVQVGGGNATDASSGTAQGGAVNVGPTVTFNSTLLGSGSAGAPGTGAGGSIAGVPGSVAAASPGVGTGSGTGEDGLSGLTDVPVGQREAEQAPAGSLPASHDASSSSTLLQSLVVRAGTLPFTGLDLALYFALGIGLLLAGLRMRAFARC
jgi:hypothetical protein